MWLWVLLAILYVVAMGTLGGITFRGGHYWLFWLGIVFPILWVVGALIPPTKSATVRDAVGHGPV